MLGDFLRKRRKMAGLSQPKLAALTGIPQTYISRIERGEVGLPQRATREKFHAALGTTEREWLDAAGEFATENDAAPPPPPATPAMDTLWPDSPRLTVAEMVEDIERRRGAWYQGELDEARQELSREEYEDFCVQLWRMFEGNSLMAFGNRKRGR